MASTTIAQFSNVVESIYDAALNPGQWPVVAEKIAALHASPCCNLFAFRLPGIEEGFAYPFGLSDEAYAIWSSGYAQKDVWVQHAVAKGLMVEGRVLVGEELLSEEDFLSSDYYQNFLKQYNLRYIMSGILFDGRSHLLPASACSVLRGHSSAAYSTNDVSLHQLVVNHLSKAMATMWRLRSAEMEMASTYSALDCLSSAIAILDGSGTVSFLNQRARGLFDKSESVSVRKNVAGIERIVFQNAAIQGRFDEMVRIATNPSPSTDPGHFSTGLMVPRKSPHSTLVIQVAPLGQAHGFHSGTRKRRAIMFISDPSEMGKLNKLLLADLYGLTPAEIKLSEELLSGDSLVNVAKKFSVSHDTAKKQLQSIFDKTSTHRQAQLIKLLLSLRVT